MTASSPSRKPRPPRPSSMSSRACSSTAAISRPISSPTPTRCVVELEDALRPHPREEARQSAGDAADPRSGGADRQAAADHLGRRRRRGARHAGRQQAARRPQGRRRQGAGLRRSPQGDAGRHRDPDRRPGDLGRSRHQARERHARHARPRQEGARSPRTTPPSSTAPARRTRHRGPRRARSRRRSRRPPRTTTARSCRSVWPSWPAALP